MLDRVAQEKLQVKVIIRKSFKVKVLMYILNLRCGWPSLNLYNVTNTKRLEGCGALTPKLAHSTSEANDQELRFSYH